MARFNNLTDDELLTRYVNNYGLDRSAITIEKVLKHWELEKALTRQLLQSNRENRKATFYNAYNTLYNELPWLARPVSSNNNELYTKRWLSLLKDVKAKRIYEIGSGGGGLINFLVGEGAICVGTEIAESRSDKTTTPNLEWHLTDGVNLADYEPKEFYDLVISDQVIEHLHPDDIELHFKNAYLLLKKNGQYVFYTPQYYNGPGDVSLVFGTLEAEGMHLKEYRYAEIFDILKATGFTKIHIPVIANGHTRMLSPIMTKAFLILEKSLSVIKDIYLRKRIYHRLIKPFNISDEIVVIAQK